MSEKFRTNIHPKKMTKIGWIVSIALFILSWAAVTTILVFDSENQGMRQELTVGDPAPRTLFSPFSLSYVKEQETRRLRKEKSQALPPVYQVKDPFLEQTALKISRLFYEIQSRKKKIPMPVSLPVSDAALAWIEKDEHLDAVKEQVLELMASGLESGVMEDEKKKELEKSGVKILTLIYPEPKGERATAFSDILSTSAVRESAVRKIPASFAKHKGFRSTTLDIFNAVFSANMRYDEPRTLELRKKAEESVKPLEGMIKKGELVVQRGELLSAEEKEKIDEIQKMLAKKQAMNKVIGIGILVFLIYLLVFSYFLYFDKKTLASSKNVALVHSIFLITIGLSKIFSLWLPGYAMPVALAPLLVVLLAHIRLGLLSALAASVLVAPLVHFSAEIILASLLSGFSATFVGTRLRKRIHFLRVGLITGLTYFFVVFSFQFLQENSLLDSLHRSAWGLANGMLVMTLSFLLLPLLEWVFNLVTDITLLELSDLNHPLLKRMIVEAPGTYHHSLVVSTLAESACQVVGANALMARVGCYFHDIGKIAKSQYFTENMLNQADTQHEKLPPVASSLVIMNHVKEGVELGRQHKLKEHILRFIPEHHGTGIIYFFYKKAMDRASPGERINPEDYRYPGPKPQSRETAVAMLADSVEGASRSLKHPTAEGIRQLVRKIINDKFIDGQLDECDLTLRDLHRIQESFVHNLMAIFHTRVSYPDLLENPEYMDLFRAAPQAKTSGKSFRPIK
ncbi:MAG: HDIG domain-containing protein [Candidatus Omnitrophica bacterium]|nr:HDIG domain-containing protein [Candidatus Omnitrophota bacterium]